MMQKLLKMLDLLKQFSEKFISRIFEEKYLKLDFLKKRYEN